MADLERARDSRERITVREAPLRDWQDGARLPAEIRLAIFPFSAGGADSKERAFSEGLASRLAEGLKQREGFPAGSWIVPVSELRAQGLRLPQEVARRFGANLVVSGELSREGDALRLTMLLAEALSGRALGRAAPVAPDGDPGRLLAAALEALARLLALRQGGAGESPSARNHRHAPLAGDFFMQARGYLLRYDDMGCLQSAIELFQRALDLCQGPDCALALAGLGEAFWRRYELQRDPAWREQAIAFSDRALEMNPRLPEVHRLLGQIHRASGQPVEALRALRTSLELDPFSGDAHRERAAALEMLGRWEEAEAAHGRAIELQPNYWAGYCALGRFFDSRNRYADAARQFEQAVALAPDNQTSLSNLGGIYLRMGDLTRARRALERCVAIKPFKAALSNLGVINYRQERYAEAVECYERALALDERDFRLWGNLGAICRNAPGLESRADAYLARAKSEAERMRTLHPRDTQILYQLAQFHAALGDDARAREAAGRALDLAPDNANVLYNVAHAYEHIGERELALACLEEALRRGYPAEVIETSRDLSKLREDGRYRVILRKAASGG